jgi:type II secretory pathway predicted ATPase ExeA
MYQRFFDLREMPFELTPNPKYLFLTPRHREALSNLQYGLSSAKAITVMLGEAGTGKTTLLRVALKSESCRHVNGVYLSNPTLTRDEFVKTLARKLELGERAGESKADLLEALERELPERRDRGQVTALVVDEAQSLSEELLEEVRLLANSETTTEKLLPLVLAGQPELRDRLNQPHLRQLKQRIALRCEIAPFTLEETAAYIATRIRTAGGNAAALFTREAVMLIHEQSRGIPRTISAVCDNALLTGFALGRRPIDCAIVREVARDFDLGSMPPRVVAPRRGAIPASATTADPVAANAESVGEEPGREAGGESGAETGGNTRKQFDASASRKSSWFGDRFVTLRLKRGAGL